MFKIGYYFLIIQYADDFVKGKNTDDAMKKLKKAVTDFVAQATEFELSINGSKCAILIFGNQKTKETIEIDNATVKIAENYRYRGITMDRHLHFGLHVKELHTALQRRLNLLKDIAGVKWGGHLKVLNILYKNFIRSMMGYVCLRVVGGFSRTTPVHVLSPAITIPTQEQRRTCVRGKEVVKSV
jgi:chorismate mutase